MHFLLGWPSTLKLPSLPPLEGGAGGGDRGESSPHSSAALHRAASGIVTEPIRHLAQNGERTRTAIVTDTAVFLFHFQQGEGMCVGVWRRAPESLLAEGPNGWALFSPDDSAIAVTTTRNVLNVLRVRDINQRPSTSVAGSSIPPIPQSAVVCSFPDAEWHDDVTMNAPVFHPIHLQLQSRVKLANDYITCACSFGEDMVLGTRGGYIQVVTWDGQAKVCVDALAWTNSAARTSDTAPPPSAVPSPSSKPSIVQVTTSLPLGLVACVFSNGAAALCDASLLRPARASGEASLPAQGAGMLVVLGSSATQSTPPHAQNGSHHPHTHHHHHPHSQHRFQHATRVAFNSRYRLLAIGLDTGDVSVYRVGSSSPTSPNILAAYLRSYSISLWGFLPADVGPIRCMEWSPDGSVLAVGWAGRGMVIWSTGGTRVACTLPMLSSLQTPAVAQTPMASPKIINGQLALAAQTPPTHTLLASPPHHTLSHYSSSAPAPATELLASGVAAMAWGKAASELMVSAQCTSVEHGFGSVRMHQRSWQEVAHPNETVSSASNGGTSTHLPSAEAHCGCGLVTRLALVRSALGVNPSQNEATSLTLLGDDRLVLWAGKRSIQGNSDATAAASLQRQMDFASNQLSSTSHNDIVADPDDSSQRNAQWTTVPRETDSENETADLNGGGRKRMNGTQINGSAPTARHAHPDRYGDSDSDWSHLPLPSAYLRHAWPVRLCALSTSGGQVACAGSQGMVLWNRSSPGVSGSDRKWRRFGNLLHESQVKPVALAWYGEQVVCVASRGRVEQHRISGRTSEYTPPPPSSAAGGASFSTDPAEDTIELLFFPRLHLDNSSLLHTHTLTRGASSFHALDISDHTMMVYLGVGQVLVYRLRAEVHAKPNARAPQMTQQQQLLAKLGMYTPLTSSSIAPALPYSISPSSLDSSAHLAAEGEIRMSVELEYVVDLCATLKQVRLHEGVEQPNGHSDSDSELTSLQSMLSSPPLQCRLWLSSADSAEGSVLVEAEESIGSSRDGLTFPSPANTNHHSDTLGVIAPPPPCLSPSLPVPASPIYELPLFSPLLHSTGLEALQSAATRKRGAKKASRDDIAAAGGEYDPGKSLTCMLLTATGQLLAIDIAPAPSKGAPNQTPFSPYTPATPSSAAAGTFGLSSPSSGASGRMHAYARIVSTEVEQFWLHEMSAPDPQKQALDMLQMRHNGGARADGMPSLNSNRRAGLRGQRLFTYGASGMHVWFRLAGTGTSFSTFSSTLPAPFSSTRLLDFDPEVYPLGLDSSIGVIVGITKGLRMKGGWNAGGSGVTPLTDSVGGATAQDDTLPSPFWGPVVCFRLQTKLQPYLHGVLMHLVANGMNEGNSSTAVSQSQLAREFSYAYAIAASCRSHSYFPVSIELLLHTALNPPALPKTSQSMRDRTLSRVVSFLRPLPEFPDSVINVARKNDASCWKRLFDLAGSPTELFAMCLARGKLRVASCYLLVLQRTEGMIVARAHAERILERIEREEKAGEERGEAIQDESASTVLSSSSTSSYPSSATPSSHSRRHLRRLSALESELQRFIHLTHGMEAEMLQQKALQVASEAAAAEVERRRLESVGAAGVAAAQSTRTPIVRPQDLAQDAKQWSNPLSSEAVIGIPPAVAHQSNTPPRPTAAEHHRQAEQQQQEDDGAGGCSVQ